jgi:hypothetical protein
MMAHTLPNNPTNVIDNTMILGNIILLQVPSITPSTPTFVNKVGCNKKGPITLVQLVGNITCKNIRLEYNTQFIFVTKLFENVL